MQNEIRKACELIAERVDGLTEMVRFIAGHADRQTAINAIFLEKLNRVEAVAADAKPPAVPAPTDVAIELLDRAIEANERQNEAFRTLMMDVRRGR